VWEGRWDGKDPSRFAVERIDGISATIVYSYLPPGGGAVASVRRPAQVVDASKLVWRFTDQGPATFTFVMAGDLNSIDGVLSGGGFAGHVTMTRCPL
jgi:hypothetical protein